MKRRHFIRTSGGLGLSTMLPLTNIQAEPKSKLASVIDNGGDRILVLIQLFGGNDGLNTVIPLDQYATLADVRGNIIPPRAELLQITDTLALHPRMAGMQQLFQNGELGIIQNVGYHLPNRSHFRSTDIWNSGSESEIERHSGWLGRFLSGDFPDYPAGYPNTTCPDPPAISIGRLAHPSCEGEAVNMSQSSDPRTSYDSVMQVGDTPLPDNNHGLELDYLRTIAEVTSEYDTVIDAALASGANTVDYPSSWIATQLKTVAKLISGGLSTKVYTIRMDGFDTHAGQSSGNGSGGNHAQLLHELSTAIDAFTTDIRGLGASNRVLGLTYSEFGRRIRSNSSRGTDHGAANMMFFFGPCINSQVVGDNPVIDPEVGQGDDLQMRIDFRDIYASILKDWFYVSDDRIRAILYPDFNYIPLVGICGLSLPVDIFDFSARPAGKGARIFWKTGNEDQNRGFELEVSKDGRQFNYLRWVPSKSQRPGDTNNYDEVHPALEVGQRYYYRLKSVSYDGQTKYSSIRSVLIDGGDDTSWGVSLAYPNPSREVVNFTCIAPSDGSVSYAMYDQSGRQIHIDSAMVLKGDNNPISIRLRQVNAGTYTVRFNVESGENFTRTVIVQ